MSAHISQLQWKDVSPQGQAIHLARVSVTQQRDWKLHTHDFYECFLIESGRGFHLVGEERVALGQQMLVFIRPEHAHGFTAPGSGRFTLTNIAIEAGIAERFMDRHSRIRSLPEAWEEGSAPAVIQVNDLIQKRFHHLVHDLAWGGREALDAEFFISALFRLFCGRAGETSIGGLPEWLQNALLSMEQSENLKQGVPRLIALCGRTPEHVSRSFQKFFKQTPSTWVNGLRIHYARQLLETTDLSITEVAYDCGFENLSYFHRLFKGSFGRTPRAHRNLADHNLGVG